MKKETINIFWSWWYTIWFSYVCISGIYFYLKYGVSNINFKFTIAIDIIFGIPMIFLLFKVIKRNEFKLWKQKG